MAAMSFRLEACPHCGSDAAVAEHPVYRYRCRACGQPRVPVAANVASTPPHVLGLLKDARKQHLLRGAWKAAVYLSWAAALGILIPGLGLGYVVGFGLLGWSLVALFTLLPILLGWWSKRKADASVTKAQQTVSQAWSEMAQHVYTLRGGDCTIDDFKRAFGVDTDSAMALLAEAEVEYLLDAQLEAPVGAASRAQPAARVRVPSNAAEAGSLHESEADLDQEAMARLEREMEAKR